jgi:hypothetical protein
MQVHALREGRVAGRAALCQQVHKLAAIAVVAAVILSIAGANRTVADEDNFLIPAPARTDMVFDAIAKVLYVACGDSVLRYDLVKRRFLSPYKLGGELLAMDLSLDGPTLLVTDRASAREPIESNSGTRRIWFHQIRWEADEDEEDAEVRLTIGKVSFPGVPGETNTHAVAFGSGGCALITSDGTATGALPLRKYDPTTGKTTIIMDRLRPGTMVSAIGDGALIPFAEVSDNRGSWGYYHVGEKSVRQASSKNDVQAMTSAFNVGIAGNGGGRWNWPIQFAIPTSRGLLIYDENFNRLHEFPILAGSEESPIGVAYPPVGSKFPSRRLYTSWSNTSYIGVWDTKTFRQLGRIPVGEKFRGAEKGHCVDGRIRMHVFWLFVTVEGGVRAIRLGSKLGWTTP